MRSERTHALDTNPEHRQYANSDVEAGRSPKDKRRRAHERYPSRELRPLVLYYQPIVDAVTGRIARVEALLRWKDPERGLMSAAGILPRLEASNLLIPLSRWVLHQVATDCCRWREAAAGRFA